MTENEKNERHNYDKGHNTKGTPSGETNSEDADTSSGGAPDDPDDVDPQTGTNQDGEPIDNPSGG